MSKFWSLELWLHVIAHMMWHIFASPTGLLSAQDSEHQIDCYAHIEVKSLFCMLV